jgi:hypothetical protein
MGRQSVFDPLAISKEPRWYTVRNMHGAVLECRISSDWTHLISSVGYHLIS